MCRSLFEKDKVSTNHDDDDDDDDDNDDNDNNNSSPTPCTVMCAGRSLRKIR